jgi:hypothetical protein
LALKAQLANWFHIAGVGVWALGMDGNNPAMLAALLGNAPVVKNFVPGPTAIPGTPTTSTTTPTTGPSYSFTGVWNESPVTLSPVDPASLPDDGEGEAVGVLNDFATDDPADACLTTGGALEVSELLGEPGVFLVTALRPQDCAAGTWTFTSDTGPGGGGGSGSTTTTTTTSTTSTTTTSTTSTTSTTTTTQP